MYVLWLKLHTDIVSLLLLIQRLSHSHSSLQRTWVLTWRSFQVRSISVVVQPLWVVLLLIMVPILSLVSAS